MRISIITVLLLIAINASTQYSFLITNIEGPNIESIYDVLFYNNKYYCLGLNLDPNSTNGFSEFYIFDSSGLLLSRNKVGDDNNKYFQIVEIKGDTLSLLGNIKSDSCSSNLIISKYVVSSNSITILSKFGFCNSQYIQMARMINGLHNKRFVEGYYNADNTFRKFVLELDSLHQFNKIFDSLSPYTHLSVDFSRKGYVLLNANLCNFYDENFNYRKQIYNVVDGAIPNAHSTMAPFGKYDIIEHILITPSNPESGQIIRTIDSSQHVVHKAIITPPHENAGFMDLPFFGSLDLVQKPYVWSAGSFGFSPEIDSNYFSITKLDSNLNIICNHFIGYDGIYRLFGLTSIKDNGAIIYGWRLPKGYNINSGGEDIYAIKVGSNCELPSSVATSGPQKTLISISAYPNPGINDLTFSVNGFDPATLSVEFFDEAGKVLFTTLDLSNSIKVPELPPGQYFYRILQKERLLGVGAWVKQ